jgi:hypothetical protein
MTLEGRNCSPQWISSPWPRHDLPKPTRSRSRPQKGHSVRR